MQAVAFLAEVVEAPAGPDPDTLLDLLRRTLEDYAQEHGSSVVLSPAVPGRTPECSAVLTDLAAAYALARALSEALFPLGIRAAAVRGEPGAAPAPEEDLQDGPLFARAAELLYRARKEGRLLLLEGHSAAVDRLANAVLLQLHRTMETWTDRQCEAVRLYRRFERQEAVAQELGISQQAVSSALVSAGWRTVSEVEAALRDVLAGRPGPATAPPLGVSG